MKQSDFNNLIRSEAKRLVDLLTKKGGDYSKEDDALSNFKKTAELIRILEIPMHKSEGIPLFFIAHKLLRLCNIINRGTEVRNEPLTDTLRDIRGYSLCLDGLITEKMGKSKKITRQDIIDVRAYENSLLSRKRKDRKRK